MSPNIDWATIWPIGVIYQSTESTDPGALFTGTSWEKFGNGRVLVGVDPDDTAFNSGGKTGGEKTQELKAIIGTTGGNIGAIGYEATSAVANHNTATYHITANASTGGTFNHATSVYRADGSSASTLQPYITVYRWRRIA